VVVKELKILVTGGTGFTGSALVFRLLKDNHEVRVFDYQEGLFADELKRAGAEIILGNVIDKNAVDAATTGMEQVFHLAAAFRELNRSDKFYYDVNVNGTRHVMESAQKHGVSRVIYCSTQGVHGNITSPPGNEASPIEPADYYQETKFLGEKVVLEYVAKGMQAIILRPMAIYGPGDPERFFMIFNRVKKNSAFPMFGRGDTLYHPLYIDNLTDAFILSMTTDRCNGEAYLIGDERYLSIEELVQQVADSMDHPVKINHYPIRPLVIAGHICEMVCKPFGISPPIFPRRVDWYRQDRAFVIDKAKNELGYRPKVSIKEGLRNTAKWYLKEGYL
jgi:nucleoside-diphosphate-sugar epimerase